MGVLPGGVAFGRKVEHGRFSSGTSGGGDRTPVLSNNPSVASTAEAGVVGWKEGDGGGTAGEGGGEGEGEEDGEGTAPGPFTDTSLEMARLRLPHMELGFEQDGFFGIDVRSLIIGREIARGAYGVVHEGKLLRSRPKDDGVDDGEQSGMSTRVLGACNSLRMSVRNCGNECFVVGVCAAQCSETPPSLLKLVPLAVRSLLLPVVGLVLQQAVIFYQRAGAESDGSGTSWLVFRFPSAHGAAPACLSADIQKSWRNRMRIHSKV